MLYISRVICLEKWDIWGSNIQNYKIMFAPWCPVASDGAFSAEIWLIFQADKAPASTPTASLGRRMGQWRKKKRVKEGGPRCIELTRIRVGWGEGGGGGPTR